MLIIFETFSHDIAVKIKNKLEKEYSYDFDIKGSTRYTCITTEAKIPNDLHRQMLAFCRGAKSMISEK